MSLHVPAEHSVPKILVIDDNSQITKALMIRLGALGFEVTRSPNAKVGALLARTECPDLIITDPEMSGEYFIVKLKGEGETKDIPVIVITGQTLDGYDDLSRKREMLGRRGVVAYLAKPVDFNVLLDVLNKNIRMPLPLRKPLPHSCSPVSVAQESEIPLDIQGELAQRGLSGKLTVIVEGLPTGGTLSAGTNIWDGTWSLGLHDQSGLCFIAPRNQTGGHTLTIRVLRLESDGFDVATTAALFDMWVGNGADGDERAEQSEMDETSAKSVSADQRLTLRLMAQWHELRGDRRCPLVSEFLSAIPPELLPDCFSIKPGKTLDESKVSLGINVARISGIIESSLMLSEVPDNTLLGAAIGSLQDALKGNPITESGEFEDEISQRYLYRSILLPLEDELGDIVQVICGARCKACAIKT